MAFLEHIPTQTYYHYCSWEAFCGIVRSKTLWFSARNASNDPRELEFGRAEIMSAMERIRHEIYPGPRGIFVSLMASRVTEVLESQQIYTASLTPLPDSIPLWREYTPNGDGLSLGFKPRGITDIHCRIHKVRYVKKGSDDLFNLISEYLKPFEYTFDVDFSTDNDTINLAFDITVQIICAIYSVKSDGWGYENELRLSFAASRNEHKLPVTELPNGDPVYWRKPLMRETRLGPVPYYDLPFGKFANNDYDPRGAFSEIVIGPNAKFKEKEIASILKQNGFQNVQIRMSSEAFR